jgi:hypothetical protein
MSRVIPKDPRPFCRGIAAGIALASLLGVAASARAQGLSEILQGSVHAPTDVFDCGRQDPGEEKECGVTFRYYCMDVPDEVNSPSYPPRGFAGYRKKKQIYLAEPVHTGNFPQAAALGSGHAWNLVFDAVRDSDSPGHIGYYGAISQIVEHGELGNPHTATCLPVIGQYACFGQLGPEKAAYVRNTPVGEIAPVGGLSPIPVPLVARNGIEELVFVWDPGENQMSRDGAPLPLKGYRLYLFPNPVNPPTEGELSEVALPVGDVIPLETTFVTVKRSDAAVAGAVTVSAALRMVYTGDLESAHFSANGQLSGLAFPDTAATKEMDDAATGTGGAARAIDIEDIYLEIRQKKIDEQTDQAYFYATLDLVGEPAGQLVEGMTAKIHLDFNDEGLASAFSEPGKSDTQDITLEVRLEKGSDDRVRPAFSGLPGIETHSGLDTGTGRLVFAVPLENVLDAVDNQKLQAADVGGGQRQILVWAETSRESDVDRVPNTDDGKAPNVAGEVIRFKF